jgi:phosphate butyryltransferase
MEFSKTFDDLAIGDEAEFERIVTDDDLFVFAHVSGNHNPLNLPDRDAVDALDPNPAPSMWLASLFSALLGNTLPGPGTLYESQSLTFMGRAFVGDRLTIKARVIEKTSGGRVKLDTRVLNGGAVLVEGVAEVRPPKERAKGAGQAVLPDLTLQKHQHVARLLQACASLEPTPTAVVAPEDENSLAGPLEAARAHLIRPILIGDEAKIRAVADRHGWSLEGVEIEDVASHDAAAARGVEMIHQGKASAIMKGALHTDELLKHVVKSQGGLRIGRRISHVFVMDVPLLSDLLLVSDAAINIAPTLEDKIDITQNAIDLGHALGIPLPKVGILAAVETVNPKMPVTIEAAALSKMADRGQIRGGLVDGPLAMDNAISLSAAETKGLVSMVAGRCDIVIVPNIEAGNILAKQLTYASRAQGAGIVLGARVPVLLTSRSDDAAARLFSCIVAVLYEAWQRNGHSVVPPRAAA